MQAFLPFASFTACAVHLDDQRLNKQITEAWQIYLCGHVNLATRWRHHPAVCMWRPYPAAILQYACACYQEWQRRLLDGERGGVLAHKAGDKARQAVATFRDVEPPAWLGRDDLHRSHRQALLFKKPEHYRRFWPDLPAATPDAHGKLPYVWIV